ncbi:hypothetical protein GHT09_015131 [Marmota monax]|uniref:Calponin-homology (CH) domain-containing protein n=1 Tax=Marmota monax TaxID=9995 RepID=A0A834PK08_MARMO|nr:hypothetical protein GHT09_015131 [Marmota monax]
MPRWRCLRGRGWEPGWWWGPGSRGLLQPGPPSALLARSTEEEAPHGHRHQQSRPQRKCAGPLPPPQGPATHLPRKRNLPLPAAEDPRGGLISRVQEAPGQAREKMEPESLYNLLQLPSEVALPTEEQLPQGAKKKYLPPSSRKDPKFEELQKVLVEWINAALLPEHVVVRSLEEDMFDGLILHHLFQKLAGLRLQVEEIALTAASQRRKLEVVLGAVNRALQVEEPQAKWSVEAIFNKDLVATLHLLVALAKHFQPSVPLPSNVQVEVVTIESTKSGLKSGKSLEQLTTQHSPPTPLSTHHPPTHHPRLPVLPPVHSAIPQPPTLCFRPLLPTHAASPLSPTRPLLPRGPALGEGHSPTRPRPSRTHIVHTQGVPQDHGPQGHHGVWGWWHRQQRGPEGGSAWCVGAGEAGSRGAGSSLGPACCSPGWGDRRGTFQFPPGGLCAGPSRRPRAPWAPKLLSGGQGPCFPLQRQRRGQLSQPLASGDAGSLQVCPTQALRWARCGGHPLHGGLCVDKEGTAEGERAGLLQLRSPREGTLDSTGSCPVPGAEVLGTAGALCQGVAGPKPQLPRRATSSLPCTATWPDPRPQNQPGRGDMWQPLSPDPRDDSSRHSQEASAAGPSAPKARVPIWRHGDSVPSGMWDTWGIVISAEWPSRLEFSLSQPSCPRCLPSARGTAGFYRLHLKLCTEERVGWGGLGAIPGPGSSPPGDAFCFRMSIMEGECDQEANVILFNVTTTEGVVSGV